MTTIRKAVLLSTIFLIASAPLALAQGTYTQFDVPGALFTVGLGIDTAGDVVGYYEDTSSVIHGFFLSNGTYSTIDYPGSSLTELTGINDQGQIIGLTRIHNLGFVYDLQNQTFTEINHPHASYTYPYAINSAGVVGGQVFYGIGQQIGFELANSRYKVILPPRTTSSYVNSVTSAGTLFGSASAGRGTLDFSFSGEQYSYFTIPGASGAQVAGVNPEGSAVIGVYNPSSGVTAGFVYQNKVFTTLQFPGSTFTEALGINGGGEVTGTFNDAQGNSHGFTWTPPTDVDRK